MKDFRIFLYILTLIFVICKIMNVGIVAEWSWYIVLSPLCILFFPFIWTLFIILITIPFYMFWGIAFVLFKIYDWLCETFR